MIYMRYSLCLIFYCIQYGTLKPKLSTVKYEHRNDRRELENSQSFHTFFISKEEAREEKKKVSYLHGGNGGQVNSRPV